MQKARKTILVRGLARYLLIEMLVGPAELTGNMYHPNLYVTYSKLFTA